MEASQWNESAAVLFSPKMNAELIAAAQMCPEFTALSCSDVSQVVAMQMKVDNSWSTNWLTSPFVLALLLTKETRKPMIHIILIWTILTLELQWEMYLRDFSDPFSLKVRSCGLRQLPTFVNGDVSFTLVYSVYWYLRFLYFWFVPGVKALGAFFDLLAASWRFIRQPLASLRSWAFDPTSDYSYGEIVPEGTKTLYHRTIKFYMYFKYFVCSVFMAWDDYKVTTLSPSVFGFLNWSFGVAAEYSSLRERYNHVRESADQTLDDVTQRDAAIAELTNSLNHFIRQLEATSHALNGSHKEQGRLQMALLKCQQFVGLPFGFVNYDTMKNEFINDPFGDHKFIPPLRILALQALAKKVLNERRSCNDNEMAYLRLMNQNPIVARIESAEEISNRLFMSKSDLLNPGPPFNSEDVQAALNKAMNEEIGKTFVPYLEDQIPVQHGFIPGTGDLYPEPLFESVGERIAQSLADMIAHDTETAEVISQLDAHSMSILTTSMAHGLAGSNLDLQAIEKLQTTRVPADVYYAGDTHLFTKIKGAASLDDLDFVRDFASTIARIVTSASKFTHDPRAEGFLDSAVGTVVASLLSDPAVQEHITDFKDSIKTAADDVKTSVTDTLGEIRDVATSAKEEVRSTATILKRTLIVVGAVAAVAAVYYLASWYYSDKGPKTEAALFDEVTESVSKHGLSLLKFVESLVPSVPGRPFLSRFFDFLSTTAKAATAVTTLGPMLLNVMQWVLDYLYQTQWVQYQVLIGEHFGTRLPDLRSDMEKIRAALANNNEKPYFTEGSMYATALKILAYCDGVMLDKNAPTYQRTTAGAWSRYLQDRIVDIKSLSTCDGKFRVEPAVIFLCGEPSQGKSTLMQPLIAGILASTEGFDAVRTLTQKWSDYVYTYSSTNQYMEGYKNQPIVIADDFFQIADPEIEARESEFLIRGVNTAAYPINQAAIPDKKQYPFFKAKFIIVTSNHEASASVIIRNKEALHRRLGNMYRVKLRSRESISTSNWEFYPFSYGRTAQERVSDGSVLNLDAIIDKAVMDYHKNEEKYLRIQQLTSETIEKRLSARADTVRSEASLEELADAIALTHKEIIMPPELVALGVIPEAYDADVWNEGITIANHRFAVSGPERTAFLHAVWKKAVQKVRTPTISDILQQKWADYSSVLTPIIGSLALIGTIVGGMSMFSSHPRTPDVCAESSLGSKKAAPREKGKGTQMSHPIIKAEAALIPEDEVQGLYKKVMQRSIRFERRNKLNGAPRGQIHGYQFDAFSVLLPEHGLPLFKECGIFEEIWAVYPHKPTQPDSRIDHTKLKMTDLGQDKAVIEFAEDSGLPKGKSDGLKYLLNSDGVKNLMARSETNIVFIRPEHTYIVTARVFKSMAYSMWEGNVILKDYHVNGVLQYPKQSKPGDSGSLILATNPIGGACVLGMHVSNHDVARLGYAMILNSDMFKSRAEALTEVIREEPKWTTSRKSKLVKTGIQREGVDLIPARMGMVIIDGQTCDPLRLALERYERPPWTPDESLCEAAIKFLVDWKTELFSITIPPLSLEQAVHGIPGDVDSLDLTTSAGYPLNTQNVRKRDLVSHDPPVISQKLKDLVAEVEAGGEVVFNASLKDELLPREKVQAGKTRMFFGSPIAYSVAVRKLLGSLQIFCKDNNVDLSMAMGIDCVQDGEKIVDMFLGRKLIGWDFKGFDTRQKTYVIRMLLDRIISLLQDSQKEKAKELLYKITPCKVAVDKVIALMTDILASGLPITLLLNCLYHLFLVSACFVRAGVSVKEARDHFRFICMGDDGQMAADPGYDLKLPPALIKKTMAEFDQHITTADKRDFEEAQWTDDLSKFQFLQRTIRFEPLLNRYLMPIGITSLWKRMLYFENTQPLNEYLVQMYDEFFRELSLHDEVTFDREAALLEAEYRKLGIPWKDPGTRQMWWCGRLDMLLADSSHLTRTYVGNSQVKAEMDGGGEAIGATPQSGEANTDMSKPDEGQVTAPEPNLVDFENMALEASTQVDGMGRMLVQQPQDVVPTISNWMARPHKLSQFSWSTGDARGALKVQLPLGSSFFNQARNYAKLYGIYGFTYDIEAEMVINATPFQQGIIMLCAPVINAIQSCSSMHWSQMTSARCVMINLGEQVTRARLVIPYTSCYAYSRNRWNAGAVTVPTDGFSDDVCNLCAVVLSPMLAGSGSPTTAECTIYVRLLNFRPIGATVSSQSGKGAKVKLAAAGKHVKAAPPQGSVTASVSERERRNPKTVTVSANQIIQDAGDGLATGFAVAFPELSFLSPAVSWVGHMLGNIAEYFGFSAMSNMEHTRPVTLNQHKGMSYSNGLRDYNVLGVLEDAELGFNPQIHQTNMDELAVAHIAAKPAWLNSFQWTTGAAVGASLYSLTIGDFSTFDVGTVTLDGNTVLIPTPVSWVMRFGQLWRGNPRIILQFAATPFHSGRAEVVFVPTTNEVSTTTTNVYTQGEYTFRQICDLRNAKTCEVSIPFTSIWNMIDCMPNVVSANSLGKLYVNVLNNLVCNSATVSTTLNVEVFIAIDDFQLVGPMPSDVWSHIRHNVLASSSFPTITQAGLGAKAVPTFGLSNADQITSLRQLMKIMSGYAGCFTNSSSSVGKANASQVCTVINAFDVVVWGQHVSQYPNYCQDTVSKVLMAFAYYRGCMRLLIIPSSNTEGSTSVMIARNAEGATTAGTVSDDFVAAGAVNFNQGSLGPISINIANEQGREVLIPYYFSRPAILTTPVTAHDDGAAGTCAMRGTRPDIYAVWNSTGGTTYPYILRAVADDFDVGTWVVTPAIFQHSQYSLPLNYYNQ